MKNIMLKDEQVSADADISLKTGSALTEENYSKLQALALILQENNEYLRKKCQQLEEQLAAGNLQAEEGAEATSAKANAAENKKELADELKLRNLVRRMKEGKKMKEPVVISLARMLCKLYEHREYGIEPATLFSYAGVKKVTGYRYISSLKDRNYVAFIGARQEGKYIMTSKGGEFVIS